jgi:transcriptional regulator GlxA family with amidase domain
MIKVTILALDSSLASSIMGPMDVFSQAGLTWNYIFGQDPEPYFQVEIVTPHGKPAQCYNNCRIPPHRSAKDIEKTDLIIIPAISDIDAAISSNRESIEWLMEHNKRGATIGSICLGAYILAETGLLDGKTATTHWGFSNDFRNRYPKINLRTEKLLTDEGNLLCSGASHSYLDLCVYLIRRYYGERVAQEISKVIIHDMGRSSQAAYAVFRFRKNHHDERILQSQEWIESHYDKEIDLNDLAKTFGMSRRTFERRFSFATGETPLLYIHKIKVEKAKSMLETSSATFDEISYKVGYEDSGFFRKIFIKHTGLRPKEYQRRFLVPGL